MPRRAPRSKTSEVDASRAYAPDDLFILPPEYRLPEVGYVVGPDSNYDLRRLLECVMEEDTDADSHSRSSADSGMSFDDALDAYEREYDCSAPRFLMGVMMLEEFRVQFSPLIPLLILELGRTEPSSDRWDTIIDILKRIVEQHRAADLLLSEDTIASVVPLLPLTPEPLGKLMDPFLCAVLNAMAPYDLTPLLEPAVRILMETTDNKMLSELLDVFRAFIARITPPWPIQRDLYRKFKEVSTVTLRGKTKINGLAFRAEFIKRFGIKFIIDPPVPDRESKEFALSTILDAYTNLAKDIAAEPDPESEAGGSLSLKLAVIHAAIDFYLTEKQTAFSPNEMKEIGKVVTNSIKELSKFVRARYDAENPPNSKSPSFNQVSPITIEALECLTLWIANGNVHGQNDQFLHMITIYVALYDSYQSDNVMLQAVRGLSGLVEYTVDGSAEFLKWKNVWLNALRHNIGILEKDIQMPEMMVDLTREAFRLVTIMVYKQAKAVIEDDELKQFPKQFYECVDRRIWITPNTSVKRAGAVLAGEVLLALARENESEAKELLTKSKEKLNQLLNGTRNEAQRAELSSLILATEQAISASAA